jgi:hypothetical protein
VLVIGFIGFTVTQGPVFSVTVFTALLGNILHQWTFSLLQGSRPCRLAAVSHQHPTLLTAVPRLCRNKIKVEFLLRATVNLPVCLGVKHPSGAYDQIIITVRSLDVFFKWGDLSDERKGLLFTNVAGPRQYNHSRVQVMGNSRPYFTASFSRLPQPVGPGPLIYTPRNRVAQLYPRHWVPFSSPPTTHRATVEVFESASTRGSVVMVASSCYI